MKIFNIKKIILFIAIQLAIFFPLASSAVTSCTLSSGAITDTSACSTVPAIQQVTFYKASLCNAAPGTPTSATPIDLSSCTTVFESPTGATVNIEQGSVSLLTNGTFTKPPAGTYNYVYIEISPIMNVQISKTFTHTIYDTNNNTNGNTCWSLTSTSWSARSTTPLSTKCGSGADGTLGLTTNKVNSLAGPGITYSQAFTTSQGKTLQAYMLTSSNKLASTAATDSFGDVSKLVGYIPQTVTISDSTSELLVNYNNYQGASLDLYTGGGGHYILERYSSGPFDIYVTAQ